MSVNITHSSTDESNISQLDEEKNAEDSPHPALLNQLIIECIFENLDKKDFRNCRLVCKKWKSVGESSFKNKVRLRFLFQEEENDEGGDLVEDGVEANFKAPRNLVQFFQMSQTEVPFTAVSFIQCVPWPPAELFNLFSTDGRFVTDLKLENVVLKSENYNTVNKKFLESYDLTPILGGIENLKTLTLIREMLIADTTTRWIVSFEKLENIQNIKLEACSIEFKTDPLIISPVDLSLKDVIFFRENKPLEMIHLNEIVNFEAVEQLSLARCLKATKISLDASGNTILKKASFCRIDLINLEKSDWIVDDLECSFSPFDKPTKMIVKQLEISDCDCVFQMLPNALQVLRVREHVNIVESTEHENISFPHLKSLQLKEIHAIEKCLPYLTRYCHNLERLALHSLNSCDELERVTIDMHMIPPTVKHLFLQGEYEFVGEGVHVLDELQMQRFDNDIDMDSILPVLHLFEPKTLTLFSPFLNPSNPVVKALFETSIPSVLLSFFSSGAFSYLKENYTFDSIDEESDEGLVIVNERGSKITILVL